jgi:hypothetical protein
MRFVRLALERPDSLAEASTARDEIGRAVALKISELKGAKELAKVSEEVLPQLKRFFEPPEERRLRRIRLGVMLLILGFGSAVTLGWLQLVLKDTMPWPAGLAMFFVGLAVLINGVWFTVPRRRSNEELGPEVEKWLNSPSRSAKSRTEPQELQFSSPDSVTENTTKQLKGSRI